MLVTQRDREIRRKMRVLEYAASVGSASQACRYFGVGRATFYRWKDVLAKEGDAGLARKKPVAKSHPRQAPPEVVEKVLHLRRTYHLGPVRIMWYLQRYHGIKLCDAGVYRILSATASIACRATWAGGPFIPLDTPSRCPAITSRWT